MKNYGGGDFSHTQSFLAVKSFYLLGIDASCGIKNIYLYKFNVGLKSPPPKLRLF